jgi:hypothetical protein
MTTRACLVAVLVAASLGPAGEAQPPWNREVLLSAGPALVGVDRLGVVLAVYGAEPDVRPIDVPRLKAEVVEKLSRAGIKHVEGEAELIPRLVVRIEGTRVSDDDRFVCRVQVALIRHVLLSSPPNLPLSAEVWQGRPALAVVAQANMAGVVSSAVAGQIGMFIDSHKEAARLSAIPSGVQPDRAVPTISGYPFVSSRSSPIFHRPDCRWAQDIAGDNRVGYKSRQEAVQAGKQPCKTCKP